MAFTVDEDPKDYRYVRNESATRVWYINGPTGSTESDVIGALYAATAPTEPGNIGIAYGVTHPRDNYIAIRLGGLPVERMSPTFWKVTANYTRGSWTDNDPLKQPPDYQYFMNQVTEPVDVDDGGNIVLNSASDLPSNPPPRPRYELTYIVGRNEATFPVITAKQYAFAANSDNFTIHAFNGITGQDLNVEPGMAIMLPLRQPQKVRKTVKYLRVEYEIKIRFGEAPFVKGADGLWDCWKIRFPDKGKSAFFTNGGDIFKLPIYTKASGTSATSVPLRITNDVLLDGKGGILDSANYTDESGKLTPANSSSVPTNFVVVSPPNGYGKILVYKGQKTAAFGSLNLFP